jgi:hypothetical protein
MAIVSNGVVRVQRDSLLVPVTKIPGASAVTSTVAAWLVIPFDVTTTVAVPGLVSNGTWKFAWNWPTKINGAATLLTLMETLPKLSGSGFTLAPIFEFA